MKLMMIVSVLLLFAGAALACPTHTSAQSAPAACAPCAGYSNLTPTHAALPTALPIQPKEFTVDWISLTLRQVHAKAAPEAPGYAANWITMSLPATG